MKILIAWSLATSMALIARADSQPRGNSKVSTVLPSLVEQAVAADPSVSRPAIAALREQGPAGFEALWAAHADKIQQHLSNGIILLAPRADEPWERLRAALDKVSGQRDDYASHLFWHTDLEQAKRAAAASGKPILSLRLLGRLDEEYSCANSRFFRTTLYANAEIAAYLRQHFVLHWKSVRPVPRITIDFGDGRKIEETITGNSIHYVLAPDGNVIDALPGLYAPAAFLKNLNIAERATLKYVATEPNLRDKFVKDFHRERLRDLAVGFNADLEKLGKEPAIAIRGKLPPAQDSGGLPDLAALNEVDWSRIAALHVDEAAFDAGSRALIARKNPSALAAGRISASKSMAENPMLKQIRRLQRSISEDTVRNEYELHATIHEWLASGLAFANPDILNRKVYAELFLTPDSDPWLGLAPADAFTGLDHGGLTVQNR